MIGNLSGIPIRLYKKEKRLFYYSLIPLSKDPMELFKNEIWNIHSHVGYYVTDHFSYYGIVNSKDYKIIIGPSRQVTSSEQELRELAFQIDVPTQEIDDFVEGMKSIVCMPLDSIMQTLCTINYILNNEKLELKDITIYESEQQSLKQLLEKQHANQAFQNDYTDLQTHAEIHTNTYQLEQSMLRIIRKGDTAALKKWINSAPAVRGGTIATDQLRQVKNTFIVSATLVSRAAISGGMDSEDALTLSDAFIQKCELLNSLEQITNLQYRMVLEFTEQVERIRFGNRHTKLIVDVANYIQHHLSEPIKAEDIAKELYLSRPYLSKKFKEESGEPLTDFILNEKIEEAKRLLRYSDKSITSISVYLGFSSLGHFSRVFRKYTDISPKEYRDKYMY